MASSSNTDSPASNDAPVELDKSDPRYRSILLLQEYHKIKKQLCEKRVQRFKDEMTQKLAEEQELLQTGDIDVRSKMMEITEKVPEVIKMIKQICPNVPKQNSDAEPKFVETPVQSRLKKMQRDSVSPHVASPKRPFKPTLDYEKIQDFIEMMDSLAKLFKISDEEEFFKKYSQLLDALEVFKDYKMSTDSILDIERRYEEMVATKDRIENMFKSDVEKFMQQLKISDQGDNHE